MHSFVKTVLRMLHIRLYSAIMTNLVLGNDCLRLRDWRMQQQEIRF